MLQCFKAIHAGLEIILATPAFLAVSDNTLS